MPETSLAVISTQRTHNSPSSICKVLNFLELIRPGVQDRGLWPWRGENCLFSRGCVTRFLLRSG